MSDESLIESVKYNLDLQHDEIKMDIASKLSALGFETTVEAPIQNWVVDVLAKKNGKVYAIEVGLNKIFKLPNLALFVDGVYHAPKGQQHPMKVTKEGILQALEDEVSYNLKRLVGMVPKLQKFVSKPSKLVIEIHPNGKCDWGFFDE